MKIADLLLLLCLWPLAMRAQQTPGVLPGDTAVVNRIAIIDPGISLGRPLLLLPPSLQVDVEPGIPPFLLTGGTPGTPPPFLLGTLEQKVDLTSPLRLQMQSEARLRPLWMVLGSVQVAGTAYAAYRYIKKYGLK